MARSPIESMLRNALRERSEVERIDFYDYSDHQQPALTVKSDRANWSEFVNALDGDPDPFEHSDAENHLGWSLCAGVRVAGYVVDLLLFDCDGGVAIECDGHEFHERTKQQAAYDRARDRDLLKLGLATVRFTGSEIHHSPERCAAEAFACARSESKRNGALMVGYDHGWASGREDGITVGTREAYRLIKGGGPDARIEEHW